MKPAVRVPGGPVDRLLSALATLPEGGSMGAKALGAAAGVDSVSVSSLLRYGIETGRVLVDTSISQRRRRYSLAPISETPAAPEPISVPAAKPAQADGGCKRGPKGKTITEPWTPRFGGKPLSEPGQAARDADMPPGVKVTIQPTPRGRFEVDPASVTPLFSALGPGRYLEGGRA